PPAAAGLKRADGRPYPAAIPFNSSVPVPGDLTFVLVVGSDARPGQDVRRANADSIHLLAVNPRTREGTVLGFPRDAYVQIPGRGNGKINSALPAGGPGLMVETVRRLTGLPIQYYVLTGFEGLASMVDALGGVHVFVDRRMQDRFSGAFFEQGWHQFNGGQALAFTRNRKDTANGDFGRSANQGVLVLAALAKMRAEVGDDGGLRRWVDVLTRHAALDVAPDRLLGLAALARNLDPSRMRNVVLPGRIGFAGRQSVVYLTDEASRIFADLRPDAVLGGATGEARAQPAQPAQPGSPSSPPPTAATPPTTAPRTTTTTQGGLLPLP
ncbi:MAG: LCP family protein, partial [Actinomycetota bacterium]|nr:LCP family protein [Actinomycetota bacterium]